MESKIIHINKMDEIVNGNLFHMNGANLQSNY